MIDETRPEGMAPPVSADKTDPPDERRPLRLLVRWLLISLALLVLVRVFVLEPYGIPFDSPSMEPTILPGDVMLVDKLPYIIRSLRYIPFTRIPIPYLEFGGFGTLRRGDVVIFDYPTSSRAAGSIEQYVKRCVAIGGDTVRLREGRILVNGVEAPAPIAGQHRRFPLDTARAWPPLRDGRHLIVPYRGMVIRMDSVAQARWRPLIESEGVSVEYKNHIVFLGGLPAVEYVVRRDYFFALGDNSSNSRDSRVFGFIPYDHLVGRAWRLYWSRDQDGNVRWKRIGKLVE